MRVTWMTISMKASAHVRLLRWNPRLEVELGSMPSAPHMALNWDSVSATPLLSWVLTPTPNPRSCSQSTRSRVRVRVKVGIRVRIRVRVS